MINQGETNVDSDNIAAAEYKYKYIYKKKKENIIQIIKPKQSIPAWLGNTFCCMHTSIRIKSKINFWQQWCDMLCVGLAHDVWYKKKHVFTFTFQN